MKTATIYYPGFLSKVGGAFFHARNLENELRKMGWVVFVVTLDSLPIWCRYVPHMVQVVANAIYMPFGFLYKSHVIRILYKFFFNTRADMRVFEDIYIAWNSDIPSLTVLHAVWSDNLQSYSVESRRQGQLKVREAGIINGLGHPLVTVSHPYRKYIEGEHFAGRLTKKIDVVELGRDQSEFLKFGERARDRKSIVYSGVLEARKNLFFMLEVFKRLIAKDPAYRLTIIGDGPDRNNLEKFAKENKLPVVFVGKMSYENVVSELHRHSIYLHTSVKESFSYSLLEAKLAGLRTCAYAGLQIPSEFVDVPLADFSVEAWSKGILSIDWEASAAFEGDRYSAERMTLSTLQLIQLD